MDNLVHHQQASYSDPVFILCTWYNDIYEHHYKELADNLLQFVSIVRTECDVANYV